VKARLRRVAHRIFVPKQVRQGSSGDQKHRGEGLANGLELVVPTVVFTLLGLGLDSWLGTKPLFLIVGFVFGVAGTFASQWYKYQARSAALDAGQPWARNAVTASSTSRDAA
jgi:F0F1-type ATP synthase assembly protein I